MSPSIRAKVVNGKLELEDPVELPEGAHLELVVVDMDDDLEDDGRARLHSALDEAIERFDGGDAGIPADQVLAQLRARLGR